MSIFKAFELFKESKELPKTPKTHCFAISYTGVQPCCLKTIGSPFITKNLKAR